MESSALDNLMALNEQLAALSDADVILDLGLGQQGKDIAPSLEKINASVARKVSRGASLDDALQDSGQAIPHTYRCLMLLGLRCGDLASTLENSCTSAATTDDSRYAVRAGFFYPIFVCCMAYVGMVGFCLFFVPTLESTYESLWLAPGPGLSILQGLRNALPYWVAIGPIVLLFFVIRRRSSNSRSGGSAGFGWLSGVSLASSRARLAIFAEMLAKLIDAGTPLEDGLEIAAGASGDDALVETVRTLAETRHPGQRADDESSVAKTFPPLLHWALFSPEAQGQRSRALRTAATVYRESADSRTRRLKVLVPVVACVVVGGGAVLLYGLALFLPVVELLNAIAF